MITKNSNKRKCDTTHDDASTREMSNKESIETRKVNDNISLAIYSNKRYKQEEGQKSVEDARQEKLNVILKLLNHPNNNLIKFDKNRKVFKTMSADNKNEKVIPGITTTLAEAFWPNYKYCRTRYSGNTGVKSSSDGLRRGIMVHEQLEQYSNRPLDQFKRDNPKLHPFTSAIIIFLREFNLTPLRSEVIIFDSEMGIATKIDMICLDKNMNMIGIEYKTGMDHYILRGNGKMNGPLEGKLSNCPLNQAFFQIFLSSVILKYRYGIVLKELWVIQAHMNGVSPYEVPDIIKRNERDIYTHFMKYKKTT